METDETTGKQGVVKMTIGALVGVVALLAYLFMGSRNETLEVQKLLTTKVEQFATTQLKLDSISTVLDTKIVEVRQLGGSVVELERIKRQLENDKKKLKSDLSFSMQQYDLKIRDYQAFLANNEVDIRKLKTENGSLRNRAQVLEQERQTILTENAGLKTEKAILAQTVVDYSEQNEDLRNKVSLASALKALNIEINALAANGRERQGGTYKASRIDRLHITFMLPSNPVAQRNNKDIYLRILDANGAVVSESGFGGTTWLDGREIGYSFRQTVPYENNDQQVNMYFRRDAPYAPGTYAVELYAEGFKIGDSRFIVK
ncbi:hypothetical protein FAES_0342 [Fibrella aestuarina BUZ 2]|uniref:Chromosome segregation protein SMC n=1 Tax=Fibrella aestuarina BUZ 2 TaxID=1166018 RepID=I0K2K2_9BACT|nr:hypothetical protein [Fibrella aestuarina]CCG98355.1 hypothetical protein FAES_0342 [Fibrella aestuarina BUZ 2]